MRIPSTIALPEACKALSEKKRADDACSNLEQFKNYLFRAKLWFDDPDEIGVFHGTALVAIAIARFWSRPHELVIPVCVRVLKRARYDLDVKINPSPGDRASKIVAAAMDEN